MMNKNGFSLIELILYVALLAVIISGVVTFGVDVVLIRSKNRVEQEVIANTRLAAKRINFEIRNASGINGVGAQSISLSNTDALKNPTVISLSSGRITIGYGSTGNCPTTAPCALTSNKVTVQSLIFDDVSSGTHPQGIRYEAVIKSEVNGAGKTFYYKEYATGSAEVRSK
jgi:type II secretory pathway pseudopilin PulG